LLLARVLILPPSRAVFLVVHQDNGNSRFGICIADLLGTGYSRFGETPLSRLHD